MQENGNVISLCSFLWIYVLWTEWFDRLINLSFLLSRLFAIQILPTRWSIIHLWYWQGQNSEFCWCHLDAVVFEYIRQGLWWSIALESVPHWSVEWLMLSSASAECWILSHKEESSNLVANGEFTAGSKWQLFDL